MRVLPMGLLVLGRILHDVRRWISSHNLRAPFQGSDPSVTIDYMGVTNQIKGTAVDGNVYSIDVWTRSHKNV